MKDISILNFDEFIENIEVIKDNYTNLLSPFFDRKMIIFYKQKIYSFKIAEWKKDKLWETLNNDVSIEEFYQIVKLLK
jgi:hypothetical protein